MRGGLLEKNYIKLLIRLMEIQLQLLLIMRECVQYAMNFELNWSVYTYITFVLKKITTLVMYK